MPITCQHNNKNDTTTHVLWRKSVSEPCSFCPSCLLQHKVSHGDNDHITYFLQLLLDLQCCPVMKVIPHRSHQSLSVDDSSCLSFYKRHEEEYQASTLAAIALTCERAMHLCPSLHSSFERSRVSFFRRSPCARPRLRGPRWPEAILMPLVATMQTRSEAVNVLAWYRRSHHTPISRQRLRLLQRHCMCYAHVSLQSVAHHLPWHTELDRHFTEAAIMVHR